MKAAEAPGGVGRGIGELAAKFGSVAASGCPHTAQKRGTLRPRGVICQPH